MLLLRWPSASTWKSLEHRCHVLFKWSSPSRSATKAMCFQLISVVLNSMSLLTYFTEPFGNEMRKKTKRFHLQLMRTYKSVTDLWSLWWFVCVTDIFIFLDRTTFCSVVKSMWFLFITRLMICLVEIAVSEPGSKPRVNTTSLPIQKWVYQCGGLECSVQVKMKRGGSCVFFSRAAPLIDLERCLSVLRWFTSSGKREN